MNPEIEACIRKNIPWTKLSPHVKQLLCNSPKEYEKNILDYSIKNQLRYRGNLVRLVKKDEKGYYDELLRFSRDHLMLFPYHLSDFIVTAMRMTPFQYYISVMQDLMEQERSYDSLPNFTAADCLRLLGIGRNQYIDLMNQCRSSKKFFGVVKKPVRDLLPVKPVDTVTIDPWWIIHLGYVTEDDIKIVSISEKQLIDKLIDDGPQMAGEVDAKDVKSLYLKGLVYMDVPVDDNDCIIVPPLEGFVMNRVLGDYFETLLYKIFVSIDEHTTVAELAAVLQIDLDLVKNAVSMYCRLGFARKKGCDLETSQYHPSWRGVLQNKPRRAKTAAVEDFMHSLDTDKDGTIVEGSAPSSDSGGSEEHVPPMLSPSPHSKRIGFLFDSTLTAFLMMGNLSHGLKSHAVTMFEVGKLSDESLDSFLIELEKVAEVGEGEAKRYFEHAITLRSTILFLRNNAEITLHRFEGDDAAISMPKGLGLDLLRCESLQNLESETCARLLNKNYRLLVSMAPLSNEIKPVTSSVPPHLGPACPEVNSMWFKLFMYSITKQGPPTLLLVRGTRLRVLPRIFLCYDKLLVTTWGHDPGTVPISNALVMLNEALCHSTVLIQGQSSESSDVVYIPFPFDISEDSGDSASSLAVELKGHPSVQSLSQKLDLKHSCGYLTMVYLKKQTIQMPTLYPPYPFRFAPNPTDRTGDQVMSSSPSVDSNSALGSPRSKSPSLWHSSNENVVHAADSGDVFNNNLSQLDNDVSSRSGEPLNMEDWTLLDCNFGIPLFDTQLNRSICERIAKFGLCTPSSLEHLTHSNQELYSELLSFINNYQFYPHCSDGRSVLKFPVKKDGLPLDHLFPTQNVLFVDGQLSVWTNQ